MTNCFKKKRQKTYELKQINCSNFILNIGWCFIVSQLHQTAIQKKCFFSKEQYMILSSDLKIGWSSKTDMYLIKLSWCSEEWKTSSENWKTSSIWQITVSYFPTNDFSCSNGMWASSKYGHVSCLHMLANNCSLISVHCTRHEEAECKLSKFVNSSSRLLMQSCLEGAHKISRKDNTCRSLQNR